MIKPSLNFCYISRVLSVEWCIQSDRLVIYPANDILGVAFIQDLIDRLFNDQLEGMFELNIFALEKIFRLNLFRIRSWFFWRFMLETVNQVNLEIEVIVRIN